MKKWMSLAFILALFSSHTQAHPKAEDLYEEALYHHFQEVLSNPDKTMVNFIYGFTGYEQSLFVDALWDLVEEGDPNAQKALDHMGTFIMDVTERLRVEILRIKYNRTESLPQDLAEEIKNLLITPETDTKLIYLIAAYEQEILKGGHSDIIALAKTHNAYYDISEDEDRKKEITDDIIADLFYHSPDVTTYMNGEYVKSVKIFMFCRENRLYPCLMTMRDIYGEVVRNQDGSLWTHPALASSARGLPSYVRNGNTPAGVMTIDSVMPTADQQLSFGKFRRMILNFIPKSKNEALIKSLLPESSHYSDWWKPTVTARDIGRNLFRIHGTGKINNDPNTPYYPFMRTSGCIAQRENTYNGVTYKDQRFLLDQVMKAMDLAPVYANEPKVKGFIYLIEIDDKNEPVTAADLALRGIE